MYTAKGQQLLAITYTISSEACQSGVTEQPTIHTAMAKARPGETQCARGLTSNRPRIHSQGISGRKQPRRAGSSKKGRHPAAWPHQEKPGPTRRRRQWKAAYWSTQDGTKEPAFRGWTGSFCPRRAGLPLIQGSCPQSGQGAGE